MQAATQTRLAAAASRQPGGDGTSGDHLANRALSVSLVVSNPLGQNVRRSRPPRPPTSRCGPGRGGDVWLPCRASAAVSALTPFGQALPTVAGRRRCAGQRAAAAQVTTRVFAPGLGERRRTVMSGINLGSANIGNGNTQRQHRQLQHRVSNGFWVDRTSNNIGFGNTGSNNIGFGNTAQQHRAYRDGNLRYRVYRNGFTVRRPELRAPATSVCSTSGTGNVGTATGYRNWAGATRQQLTSAGGLRRRQHGLLHPE